MLKKLLEYQEIDGKLRMIEQEISGSDEYKKYQVAKKFLEKAPEKLDFLDKRAEDLKKQLITLQKKYGEITETVKDFDSLDELIEQGADTSFYKKRASAIAEELKSLKAEIKKIQQNIVSAGEEYAGIKKQTIANQKQFKEYKPKFEEIKQSKAKERDSINKELLKLASELPAETLKRYNAKRSEKIFPILCPLNGNRCSQCGMELSISDKTKLSNGEFIECDSCHRFIYLA